MLVRQSSDESSDESPLGSLWHGPALALGAALYMWRSAYTRVLKQQGDEIFGAAPTTDCIAAVYIHLQASRWT